MALLKGNHTGEKVLLVSRDDLARRSRESIRCAQNVLVLLERCGYLRRDRDRSKGGAPHCIVLCYDLRPALKLEAGPPIAKGPRGASNRHRGAGCSRHGRSGCNRHNGAAPYLFEQRDEKETTTDPVVENASSFLEVSTVQDPEPAAMIPSPPEPPDDPPDDPDLPTDEQLAEIAREQWPDEPNVTARVIRLAKDGLAVADLAIQYAVMMKARSFAYVASTAARWRREGYDLVDIQAEVWGATPKSICPPPVFHQRPEKPPPEEIEAARRQLERDGWRSFVPAEPEKNPAAGQSPTLPSAGRSPSPVTRSYDSKHTVKGCSRQESRGFRFDGLLALGSSFAPEKDTHDES